MLIRNANLNFYEKKPFFRSSKPEIASTVVLWNEIGVREENELYVKFFWKQLTPYEHFKRSIMNAAVRST